MREMKNDLEGEEQGEKGEGRKARQKPKRRVKNASKQQN